MNALEKLHALMVCEEVHIWHFPAAKGLKFVYWLRREPENLEGYRFERLEQMIDAAYAEIDPLRKPFPESIQRPASADHANLD